MPSHTNDPMRPQNLLVKRRWLAAGIGVMVVAAVAAVYLALVLLFWQGQWQLIYHPSHVAGSTPQSIGLSYDEVRFDATETGQPQLHGWWVPAGQAAAREHATVLYLHDAHGSLADTLPDIRALHTLGVDVFAFDPRGFGASAWAKPSEQRWNQDAAAALAYMISVRHVVVRDVVPLGRGLGGTVAANLTVLHPEIDRVVMVGPQPLTLALLTGPRWTHILPVRLLARDAFDPSAALRSSRTDKLFLTSVDVAPPTYIAAAAAPKHTVPGTLLGDAQVATALHHLFEQRNAAP